MSSKEVEELKQKLYVLYQQLSSWFEKVSGITQLKARNVSLEVQLTTLNNSLEGRKETIQVQLEQIRILAGKINLLQTDNEELQEDLEDTNGILFDCEKEVLKLQDILDRLDIIVPEKPDWLNANQVAYHPYIQIPKVDEGYSMEDPTGIYTGSEFLYKEISGTEVRILPTYESLIEIWKYVVGISTYESDVGDNWQPHPITIVRGKGDCDDTTILFVDACRMIGIPADKVFNAVGPTSFGYHSYPIVYLTREEIEGTPSEKNGEGWYIFETTLHSLSKTPRPRKLVGSPYWVNSTANWEYQGKIYSKSKAQFNGTPGGKMTGASKKKEKKIDYGKKKIEEINNDWIKWEEQEE